MESAICKTWMKIGCNLEKFGERLVAILNGYGCELDPARLKVILKVKQSYDESVTPDIHVWIINISKLSLIL